MKISGPKLNSTICASNLRDWAPSSLANLLKEIDYLIRKCQENDSLILFRGQTNGEWPLDSTFVRNSITTLFEIKDYQILPPSIRHQVSFHRSIASLLLMKFDRIIKPSGEAFAKELSHGIDPYFELLKHVQQYPETYQESPFIKGTNLIDWTGTLDIALYFATYKGKDSNKRISTGDGAIWVYDASSTGNILQTGKMKTTLDSMTSAEFLSGGRTFPLMFHPQKQTNQLRSSNQQPAYIAQMDFRYDFADVWANYDKERDEKAFFKINIQEAIKYELADHLESRGVSEERVYPH